MAAPRKIFIPSLSEMDDAEEFEKEKGTLFKRHKSSREISVSENSDDTRVKKVEGKLSSLNSSASISRGETSSHVSASISRGETSSLVRSEQSASRVPKISSTTDNETSSLHSRNDSESSKSSIPSKPGSSNHLVVNPRQRGNPILKSVRNVPWEYGNIAADYVMGPSNCALFLSLRYHQLHPNYIHDRLKKLGRSYELRVMLVQVDVKEPHHLLKDLAKICLLADCTLILAFSPEEAGKYLETYKVFENKPAEAIMERTEDNHMAKFVDCLTRVKSVNKTDCATLMAAFGSLANVMEAQEDELCLCPGFGPQKAKRLHSTFQEPFLRNQPKSNG